MTKSTQTIRSPPPSSSVSGRIIFLALLLCIVHKIQAQNNGTWTGCVDPANPDADSRIFRGQLTTICIVVSSGGDWAKGMNYRRWTFRPKADHYSHFTAHQSYNDMVFRDPLYFQPKVSVHVESQTKLSFIRRFYDQEQLKVYPFLTAIIDVSDGVIRGITWDKACLFCETDLCEENTYHFNGTAALPPSFKEHSSGCYLTKSECDTISKNSKSCDLNIYFVWSGTDANGELLSSFGSRFSAFPPNNIPEIEFPNMSFGSGR